MIFNSVKEAFAFYNRQGFRCMPVVSIDDSCIHDKEKCKDQCLGKVPATDHWPDVDFSQQDFNDNHNLALIMGKQLDGRWLVGFDIDGILPIEDFFQLPETLECLTRRGRHLIFEVPPDSPLGNWRDILSTRSKTTGYKHGFQGALDVKYSRGAMVSPPSKSKEGFIYTWKKWMQPSLLPHSEIVFLLRKIKAKHPDIKRYSKWSSDPMHKGKRP